jgi:hypothetical protein
MMKKHLLKATTCNFKSLLLEPIYSVFAKVLAVNFLFIAGYNVHNNAVEDTMYDIINTNNHPPKS